jgi:hypothetical protein
LSFVGKGLDPEEELDGICKNCKQSEEKEEE